MKVEPALDDLNIKKKGLNVNKRPLHVANLKSGRGNLFALAYGAAAWSAQASPFFETKTSFKIRFTAESRRSLRKILFLTQSGDGDWIRNCSPSTIKPGLFEGYTSC